MYLFLPRAILISVFLSALSFTLSSNSYAAPCDTNFTSNGSFITGSTYKTFSDIPNVSAASAFEGALADIAKEPSWKILAQDKSKGMIQAVQAESYNKGKVIPLNINIVPAGNGAKINMDYVTPTGSLSPASAVKNQFCQTIAAAENFAGGSYASVAVLTDVNSPVNTNNVPRQLPGIAMITAAQQNKISKEIAKKTAQKDLQTKILEASSIIQQFLEKNSCINTISANNTRLIYFAANSPQGIAPMLFSSSMHYHNKEQCVTVSRVSGWASPALNALRFEVVYLADDSGEVVKQNNEVVKQPDGEWLFTN